MLRSRRSVAAAVLMTLSLPGLAGSLAAQSPGRAWTFNVGGGYATQLDPGSSGLGSFSLGASALRARSPKLSLGIEGGYDRHESYGFEGQTWWDETNWTTGECPEPCTLRRVTMAQQYVGAAWHLGGVLRYTFAPGQTVVPSAELGLGLYGLRYGHVRRTRDAISGAPIPELSGGGTSTDLAPGVSGALGVDFFPGNGRVGFGAVARLRVAGRPAGDILFGIGFASLQARVTIR